MQNLKKTSLFVAVIFYLLAGINHFRAPVSYLKIIPPYLPLPVALNYSAGVCEIGFAFLLIPIKTRRYAAWGIILMLIAFLPVHISMVSDAPLMLGSLKVTPFVAWIRLGIFQPLLVLWAWWYTDISIEKKK